MKSAKKFLAATLALTHFLTFSAPMQAQVININENTSVQVDSINVNAGEQLTINVLDQLGQVCPSCRGILETNNLLNNGIIDIWGVLAIIAPTIINNGTITVQGDLLLSNLGINKEQFFAGIAELSKDPAFANGYILNTGEIKNLTEGLLALVAANGGVHNLGTISSNGGAVLLTAGDRASFPLTRDGVLNISLSDVTGVKGQVFDKDGNLVETNGLVTNAGVLQANGGAVVLQAAGAEAVYDSIINHTGIIEAKSIAEENGKIILKSQTGNITVTDATIDASGYGAGEKGGSIELLTAGNIIVDGQSVVDASGDIGGGTILIGGDVHGAGDVTASNVGINSDVKVKADAVTSGNGGKIVVWSEGTTLAYGDFSATGGAQFGNGGFIETSGKEYLDVEGIRVNASAANGENGEWLLDPRNVEVRNASTSLGSFNGGSPNVFTPSNGGSASAPSIVSRNTVQTTLNGGTDVTINTTSSLSQNGDITVVDSITAVVGGDGIATLSLVAAGSILVNAAISNSGGILNVVLTAGNLITIIAGITTNGGSVTASANGDISLSHANADITTAGGAIAFTADANTNGAGSFNHLGATGSGTSNINSGGGDITITANNYSSDSDSAINAGAGTVFLKNAVAGTTFGLGNANEDFDISDSEGDRITAGKLEIGTSTAGDIEVNAFGPANVSTLVLRTGDDVRDTASGTDVTVTNLAIHAGDTVDIDTNVNNLAITAGGDVTIDDSGSFTVGTVDGLSGVTTTNDDIDLEADGDLTLTQDVNAGTADVHLESGDDIEQTGGAITADELTFAADEDVTLNQAANQFNSVDGSRVDGNISIADSGTNTEIKDLQTDGGSITYVHTGAGDVTVTGSVDTADGSTNGGAISLTSSNLLTIAASAVLSTQQGSGGTFSAGAATVNGTVTVGAGDITLTGGGSVLDLIINTPISGATNVILTALRDIILNTSITTTGGASVSLTADSDLDGVGGLWLKNTGSINSDGNVTLTGSAIFDSGAAGESIRIDADGANNQILAAGDIILQKSAAAPSTADITVDGIVNTTGVNKTITVNSNDQINSSDNGVAEFVGANLALTAKNGINVESDVTNASYNNSTSGDVAIEDMAGGLTITGATNSGSGSTTILTHSPLTIAANMIQVGTINLTASESGAAGDDLTVNSGVTVQATGVGSDVNLNAGDNVVLNTTSVVQSDTGAVTVTAGSGDTDNAGNISLGGLVGAATTATLSALEGAITDTNGAANNLTATSLTASSLSGIDLDTTITTLTSASVSGTGAINLSDLAGGLAVTSATTNDGAVTINATGGNLDVTAATAGGGEDINLGTITSGNVNVGNVTAAGDNIVINSAGAIEELGADADADLTANDLDLTAVSGIGAAGAIETDATTLLNANVTGTGAIDINDLAGGLAVTSATTADGAITINATGGNLDVTVATAGGGEDINLGTITSGDVKVGNVTAAGDNIVINSAGAIEELGADAGADLTANDLDLTAVSGIGAADTIETDATTLLNANVTGAGAIDLSDVAGGLAVSSATTFAGNIILNAIGGNLDVTSAIAGGGNDINLSTTTSGDVNVDNVSAVGGDITVTSAGSINELGSDIAADLTASTINLIAQAGGIGTLAEALEFLATAQFNADSTAANGDINVRSTGNAPIGLIDAGTGDVLLTSEGNITDANDGGTPDAPGVLNINGGDLDLVTVNGDDIGEAANYLEIQPSTSWGVVTNGGDAYIACIGVCPMDQVDLGTGNFFYVGNITDANDLVNGEHVGGVWNIRAGGVHLDADNSASGFIGGVANWIEMRLARDLNSDTTLDANGLFVATAGTGGIHVSNDVPSDASLGLQIGGLSAPSIPAGTGVTSAGGIEIYSFSPLVIAANVIDNSASSIDLVAAGNIGSDDLTVNTGVTIDQQGSGAINLFAGDDIQLQGTALVQSNGGVITAAAGEDRTGDLIGDALEFDGTNAASIVMNNNSAFRSQGGNIGLTANNHLRISEVNATTVGDVTLTADANGNGVGRIEDRNGANQLNVTGDDVTMTAGSGIGVDGANAVDAIETSINNLTLTNTTSGHVAVTEVNAGGALNIVSADQQADGGVNTTMDIHTNNGTLTVVAAPTGSGVQTRSGELTLAANGGGANDDLVVNNTVTSTTAKINLDSNSRDVLFSADGDVTATGGAEIEVSATNNITMADGTILNANAGGAAGAIELDAGNDITLGSVQTTNASSADLNGDAFNAVQIDAGGAVIDGGDSDDDIIANNGQATINAVNGIGSADQLDVQLASLRMTNTTAGDIRVRELVAGGNLDLVGVDQQAVAGDLRVRTENGTLTVVAAGLGGLGVSAVDGITRLFAADSDASGADHLRIRNTVVSNNGKINLDSENDVRFTVNGDVTSVTGEIEVDAADDILMADNLGVNGTVLNAGSGRIDLDAGGRIRLTSVQTTNSSSQAVVIVAGQDIIDGGDTDVDILTGANGGMILAANSGIGSRGTGVNVNPNGAANNFATDALDTQGGRLAAITQSGDIQIANTGALEITTLTDTDGGTPMGSPGAGTVTGILNNDAIHLDPASIIFITAASPMTVSSTVINLDGGNISLYAMGGLVTDTMTVNANVQTFNGNGDVRLVSGGAMTLGAGVNVSTQGDGAVSGTGRVAIGAGFDATGKAADASIDVNPLFAADVLPGLNGSNLSDTSTDPAGSLLDTAGDTTANLTMDETSRISTESGNIIVDAQNNFTVGRVDADGNAGTNGITDGIRGNILAFARNGSILDAEGPGEIGNLDFLANSLTMLAAGTIGLSDNRIEGTAPFLNTFSIGSQFVSMQGDTQVEMNSSSGSIFLNATGTILLGHMSAPSGEVQAVAGGNILSQGGGETRVTASNLIELIANGIVGTTSNPIHTHLNATPAQINLSAGGQAGNGVSAAVFSNVSPLALNMLNNPPGLVLFNGTPVAGAPLPGLIGSQSSLYYKAFVRGLRQYSDFDGNYAADFPGFMDFQSLITSPNLDIDTSALDQVPLRGIVTLPRVVPLPTPAQPTPVQPETAQVQVPSGISQETTPPLVVPIPGRAIPSGEPTTDEGVPETPATSN